MSTKKHPEIISQKTLVEGKFLNLVELTTENPDGTTSKIECTQRSCWSDEHTTEIIHEDIQKNFGAVDSIATAIDPKTSERIILLQKNFRPPVMNYVVELPSGFRDPGEPDPVVTGLRELKEETGYTGTNGKSAFCVRNCPIDGDERGTFIYCDIDLKSEDNKNPIQNLEEDEDIEPFWTPLKDLKTTLDTLHQEQGYDIDERLYSISLGLQFALTSL
ncbi:unnamed protein product [Moneuplotes crassus]|uniref:Nudix hydrolase domain-containing protein n=1 Tax=Euplotes crassus TaxID=5936 RepID=A0AAD1XSR2_EUPCR|nr:unnamed protein product [Moneuplotes crassus]